MSNESKGPASKLRPDGVTVQTVVQVSLTLSQLYALRKAAETVREIDKLYSDSADGVENTDISYVWNTSAYAANIDFVDSIATAVSSDIAELSKLLNKG